MKTVRLQLTDENGVRAAEIKGEFSDGDLRLLRLYLAQMQRVRDTELVKRGVPFISNIEWHSGSNMQFTCAPYSNPELHELLHVLRPLILDSEQASFQKTLALLGRRFRDKTFASHQRHIRHLFEHGELSMYMQISVGGQKLLDDSLLRIWLNGTQYHTDAGKADAWAKLETSLTTENARAVVITQINSRLKALFLLEHVVRLVAEDKHEA